MFQPRLLRAVLSNLVLKTISVWLILRIVNPSFHGPDANSLVKLDFGMCATFHTLATVKRAAICLYSELKFKLNLSIELLFPVFPPRSGSWNQSCATRASPPS